MASQQPTQTPASGTAAPLRRNQAATSSTNTTNMASQQRRRIDDSESNWMDPDFDSTEEDTEYSSEDELAQQHRPSQARHHHSTAQAQPLQQQTGPGGAGGRNGNNSSASLSSASTLYDSADRGRTGGRAGGDHSVRKPLISYVTNEWEKKGVDDEEKHTHPYYQPYQKGQHYYAQRLRSPSPNCCDDLMETDSCSECLSLFWRRFTFRILAVLALIVISFRLGHWWFGGAAQQYSENSILRQSVRLKLAGEPPRGPRGGKRKWFGSQATPEYTGLTQLAHLNQTRPEFAWENGKRLVIVGDVHGCADQLEELLKKVKFYDGNDHLAFTGDLVAKGPESGRVLDIAMQHNASCVRGNHDDRVLLLNRDVRSPSQVQQKKNMNKDGAPASEGEGSSSPDSSPPTPRTGEDVHGKERDLARTLSDGQISYLASCPLILSLGSLPGLAPKSLLVHAGLIPGLNLSHQDPALAMHMRSVDVRTHTPVKVHSPQVQRELREMYGEERYKQLPPPWDGKKSKIRVFDLDEKYVMPWRLLWEEYQRANPAKDEKTLVVYGHDSMVGLQDKGQWAVGLDSGCVNGGRLSALVLEMKRGSVRRKVVSVDCSAVERKAEEREGRTKKKKGAKKEKRVRM